MFALALGQLGQDGPDWSFIAAWIPSLGIDFALRLDGLSLLMVLLISGVGTMVFVYAGGYMAGMAGRARLFVLLLLFMVAMLGCVTSDNLLLLFLGMFMDASAITMLAVPLLFPVITALGFDPVWFGVVLLLGLELGLITPPFGLLLFVMVGVSPPGTTVAQVSLAALPFIACILLLVLLLMFFPELALWLPNLMRS